MLCANCNRELLVGAKSCQYCEAEVLKMPKADKDALQEILDQMPEDAMAVLHEAATSSETGSQFVAMLMVGKCPSCGSVDVEDCEHTTGVEDCTVGRCHSCGKFWCLECGEVFAPGQKVCRHWGKTDGDQASQGRRKMGDEQ